VPARLAREARDLGKAEAGTLPRLLGGEERLARSRRDLGRHAGAGVGNRDHDVRTGSGGVAAREIRRLEREKTRARHRIARVEGEVEQRGLELPGIGGDVPHVRLEDRPDGDALAERMAQQLGELRDEVVRIERPRLGRLAAREGEQLPGERGGAIGAAADHLEVAAGVGLGVRVLQDLERAADDVQRVVEIVRDTAREQAERFHFLRVRQGRGARRTSRRAREERAPPAQHRGDDEEQPEDRGQAAGRDEGERDRTCGAGRREREPQARAFQGEQRQQGQRNTNIQREPRVASVNRLHDALRTLMTYLSANVTQVATCRPLESAAGVSVRRRSAAGVRQRAALAGLEVKQQAARAARDETEMLRASELAPVERHSVHAPRLRPSDEQQAVARQRIVGEPDRRPAQGLRDRAREIRAARGVGMGDEGGDGGRRGRGAAGGQTRERERHERCGRDAHRLTGGGSACPSRASARRCARGARVA
jgi:hypothetical protein